MPPPLSPTSSAPSVLVVLLNWNSYEETIAAVHSVLAMDYPNFSVVIIDNGSTDGSPEHLRPLASPRVHLLFNPENTGYTGGCNRGIALALERGDDFVWLLNSDALTEPDTLASLVRFAQSDPRLALVSPRILSLDKPGSPVNLGGVFDPDIPSFETTRDPRKAAQQAADTPGQVVVLGTALLLRTSILRQIGVFDDNLFAYWEDSDLSVRAIRAGFRNAVDFHSAVLHKEKDVVVFANNLSPYYWYYMARNEIRFWRKHTGGLRLAKALRWNLQTNRVRLTRLDQNKASRQAIVAGLWDGWLGRAGAWHPGRKAPALVERLISPLPLAPSPTATTASQT